ncbi:Uncharacterised protein [Halioglobus japonicus]|nr:Uncharacterised protein [Halioglobus japonicus]
MNEQQTITESKVATLHGASYLKRLCRHFSHKVPTTVTETQGRIELPFGACRIDVDPEQMLFRIEVENPADLARAEEVVSRHLIQIANRDEPTVQWNRHAISS